MPRIAFACVPALALASWLLPVSGAGLEAQQQAVFRATTQTVPIYATVLDGTGRLVGDLERQHFDVFDDGKRVDLTVFKSDVQPVTVVVMLDTSGSMTLNIQLVKQAAEQFAIRIMPEDRVRLASFAEKTYFKGVFTGDRDALIRLLHDDIQFGNGTHLWDAIADGMDTLADVKGRRVVLAFTDGEDETSDRVKFDDLLTRAQADDIMIYAIGLKNFVLGRMTRPDVNLKRLAHETGGGYFDLSQTTELAPAFTRIADELHRQYVMGFAQTAFDGKLHVLDVRVKVDGMTARARKSYVATRVAGEARTP